MALTDRLNYTQANQALTTVYQEFEFIARVKGCFLHNKAKSGESTIEVSLDGTRLNAIVYPGDVCDIGNLVNSSITTVSLKYTVVGGSGAPDYQMGSSEK